MAIIPVCSICNDARCDGVEYWVYFRGGLDAIIHTESNNPQGQLFYFITCSSRVHKKDGKTWYDDMEAVKAGETTLINQYITNKEGARLNKQG